MPPDPEMAANAIEAAVDELRTVQDLVRFGVSRLRGAGVFFGHGFVDARAEAAYLVQWALGLPPGSIDDFSAARVLRTERRTALELLERRVAERLPAPYLTHEAWLGQFAFYVDERVLIPRSFIADLLLERLAPWVSDPEGVRTGLDLCTGSGCLAVMMAHAFPDARIDAVDLSPDALTVAHRNVDDYGLADRVALRQSDLLKGLADSIYDVIVCNPPYVNGESMATLPAEYRHEPAMALAGGEDGLDLVHRLLAGAAPHLSPNGILVVEIGHNRTQLEAAYPKVPFTWLETHAGDEFVFVLTREQLP